MFHPDPEIEEFHSYSVARVRPNLSLYARDGAGQSLGMAYQMMYSRFHRYYGNRYSYWNPYYYGGIYNDTYTLAGHTMYVPLAKFPEKGTPRKWSRDGKSSTTNLTITRTTTESSNNDSGQTNSSNVSSTRGTSSSSSSSSNSRTRATRRN